MMTDHRPGTTREPIRVNVLGSISIEVGGIPVGNIPAKAAALLCYMAVEGVTEVPVVEVLNLLWGASTSKASRHSLSQLLYKTRKDTANVNIERKDKFVVLQGSDIESDYQDFLTATRQYQWDEVSQAALAGMAIDMEVPSEAFRRWRDDVERRLHEKAVGVARRCVRSAVLDGDWMKARSIGDSVLRIDPYDEEIIHGLASAMIGSGDLEGAASVLDAAAQRYGQELSRPFPPELENLVGQLRDGSPPQDSFGDHTVVPLTGRQTEIRDLRDKVFGSKSAAPTVIEGSAGVGKSRVAGMVARIGAIEGWFILYGKGRASQSSVAYGVLGEMLTSRMERGRLIMSDGEAVALQQVVPGTNTSVRPPRPAQREVFSAVDSLINRLAAGRPVLVVLDDAHWGDPSSLAYLDYSTGTHANVRILLAVRPTSVGSDVLGGMLSSAVAAESVVPLGPLSESSSLELARSIIVRRHLQITEERLRDALIEAKGNPFFLTELLRNEHASTVQRKNSATILRLGSKVALPPAVAEVLKRSLVSMSVNARLLASALAVIGGRTRIGTLVNILECSLQDALSAAAELRERGVVQSEGGLLVFSHDLTMELVADVLGSAEAQALHQNAARVLGGMPDIGDSILSYHYDRAEDQANAFSHAIAAFDNLLKTQCFAEAETHLMIARRNARSLLEKQQALERHCVFLIDRDRWAEAVDPLAQAIHLATDDTGVLKLRLRVAEMANEVEQASHNLDDLVLRLEELFIQARRAHDKASQAKCVALRCWLAFEHGDAHVVDSALKWAVLFAESCDDGASAAKVLSIAANVVVIASGYEQALPLAETAVVRSEGAGDEDAFIRARLSLANVLMFAGRMTEAVLIFEEMDPLKGRPMARGIGQGLQINFAVALIEIGDYASARFRLELAKASSRAITRSYAIANLPLVFLHLDEPKEMMAAAVTLLSQTKNYTHRWYRIWAETMAGLAALANGDVIEASERRKFVEFELDADGPNPSDISYPEVLVARVECVTGSPERAAARLEARAAVLRGRHEPARMRLQLECATVLSTIDPTRSRSIARSVATEAKERGLLGTHRAASRLVS